MPRFQGKQFKRSRKNIKRGGGVVLPSTNPSKGKDWRFKQVNQYKIKPEPMPRVLYTRAKFGWEGNLNQSIAGAAIGQTFRLNSIYDPDYTYVGPGSRTVVGHNILSSAYARYLVLGAKVSVSFNNPTVDGCRVGCRIRINANNPASGNTMQDIAEKEMTYMKGLNDTGKQTCGFSFFVRPWTMTGLSKLEYMANTSSYSSAMNGNPATENRCLFDIFLINPTVTAQVRAMVRIVYYVQCYDRIAPISSTHSS